MGAVSASGPRDLPEATHAWRRRVDGPRPQHVRRAALARIGRSQPFAGGDAALSRAVRRAHRAQADAGVAARDSDRRRARGCRHGRVALSLRLVPVAAAEAAVYRRAGHARASAVGGVVPCEPTQARRHRARPRIALRARRSSARDRRAHRGLGAPYARGLNAIARRCRSVEEGEIMAQQKFLVTGATGDTRGYTVELRLERGTAAGAPAQRGTDRSN